MAAHARLKNDNGGQKVPKSHELAQMAMQPAQDTKQERNSNTTDGIKYDVFGDFRPGMTRTGLLSYSD